jgi:hypothetical protein
MGRQGWTKADQEPLKRFSALRVRQGWGGSAVYLIWKRYVNLQHAFPIVGHDHCRGFPAPKRQASIGKQRFDWIESPIMYPVQ